MTDLAGDLRALVEELKRREEAAYQAMVDNDWPYQGVPGPETERELCREYATRLRALLAKHEGTRCDLCGSDEGHMRSCAVPYAQQWTALKGGTDD